MRAWLVLAVLLLVAPLAPAALVTGPLQTDAGAPGDAGDAPASARALPGPGAYEGTLVAVDDAVDVYRVEAPRDARLGFALGPLDVASLEVLDPSGALVSSSAGRPAAAVAFTDVAGGWLVRVASPFGGRYSLTVALAPASQDDGGTLRDAGWRLPSSVAIAANATRQGNLSAPLADCADLWTFAAVANSTWLVRVAWSGSATLTVTPQRPSATEVKDGSPSANTRELQAKATANATWTFRVALAAQAGGGCAPASAQPAYHIEARWVEPPPPPDDPPPPPPPPPPEIHVVQPSVSRPLKVVEVQGRNLTGARFDLGGVAVPVLAYATDGRSARVVVPRVAPGVHDLVATRDGATNVSEDALAVLPPADVEVAALFADPPQGPALGPVRGESLVAGREVVVHMRNAGPDRSEGYLLQVYAIPEPTGPAPLARLGAVTAGGLAVDETREHRFGWDHRLSVGTYRLYAVASPSSPDMTNGERGLYDADASNDQRAAREWVWVDPGVGVGYPARLG